MNANTAAEQSAIDHAAQSQHEDPVNEEPDPVQRDIEGATEDDEPTPSEVSEQFLLGDLIKASSKHFKSLAKPWSQLTEAEQSTLMRKVADDAGRAVKQATRIIRSENRMHFMAEVESVTFKDGVKSVLKTINSPESHALADKAGGIVMIVIDDGAAYMEIGDACSGDPDQPSLFDQSTEGTALDTQAEED